MEILRKYIQKILKESLIGEDYPTQFDMNIFKSLKTFKERIEYCQNNLKRLNSGSSRIVYKIDDKKVLKLAKNKKGIAQNETEIDYSNYPDINFIFTKIFEYNQNNLWVEMELALPVKKDSFKRITGYSFEEYCAAINNYANASTTPNKRSYDMPIDKSIVEHMWEDEFVYGMFQYIGNYDTPVGDLKRLSSYGIVNRNGADTIVLVDFGITAGVCKDFYAESILNEENNLSDYKKWKRKNVTIRGISTSPGEFNGAGASLGDGLYTASLSNKEMARKYGGVYFVVNARPKNPKVFDSLNRAEIWLQQNIYFKNHKNVRDFFKDTTIENEMLKLGYDGVEIIGREMVSYKPENVKYFKTESELINYYENSINITESTEDDLSQYQTKMSKYHQRKKDFFDSITSFNDITDEKIPQIIDYLGCEGFNSDEDAIEDLTEKVNIYKKLSNPVTLYRLVAVKNKKLINTKELGEHFVLDEWAIDDDMLRSIGQDLWDSNWKPYIMKVSVPLSEIDVRQTIVQNLSFPNEAEINLKNKGKGAKFIKATKYK